MSYPNAIEVCRAELFTKEVELRDRYPQALVAKALRMREMYNWFIDTPTAPTANLSPRSANGTAYTPRRLIPTLPLSSRCFPCL